jgi:hypothetical protein
MITDKPEDLEAQAALLTAEARGLMLIPPPRRDAAHVRSSNEIAQKLEAADRLRERAAQLRKRRTDGVRFG